MTTASERADMILRHERQFAEALARNVIEKPRVSVWMILIPILFVYYMYRHSRYVEGKKQFIDHYCMSRENAMREILAAGEERRLPDTAGLAAANGVPEGVQPLLREVLEVLIAHFSSLLRAEGETMDDLLRSAYGSGTDYLLVMNRLNAAERKLYDALSVRMEGEQEGVNAIVLSIETNSERLRREEAARIFG